MSMIRINRELCKGCVNCIRVCPTEALRVRNNKAVILEDRCIDCGECITTCPDHAIEAILEGIENIASYRYKIALISSVVYAQFGLEISPYAIREAIKGLGFDATMDVSFGAEASISFLQELLKNNPDKVYISSMCPSVVKLIQLKYPSLVENLAPVASIEEIAARYIREEAISKGYREEDIGVFLITPCTAKIADIKKGRGFSYINGAISVSEIYRHLIKRLPLVKEGPKEPVFGRGISWVRDGGESRHLQILNYLVVDGVKNVLRVLDDLELGKLRGLNFIEGRMCSGGCVGGPLNVQNPYLARVKIRMLEDSYPQTIDNSIYESLKAKGYFKKSQYKPQDELLKLGEDISDSINKMRQIESILEELPGIDCGSCGAPNCRALAEDIVKGEAKMTDCIFKLKENIEEYAKSLLKIVREEK
ncbi:MAG: [Fe-Fe] hydrogenase large subunit C-terminal domain-containing protein [bacterium]